MAQPDDVRGEVGVEHPGLPLRLVVVGGDGLRRPVRGTGGHHLPVGCDDSARAGNETEGDDWGGVAAPHRARAGRGSVRNSTTGTPGGGVPSGVMTADAVPPVPVPAGPRRARARSGERKTNGCSWRSAGGGRGDDRGRGCRRMGWRAGRAVPVRGPGCGRQTAAAAQRAERCDDTAGDTGTGPGAAAETAAGRGGGGRATNGFGGPRVPRGGGAWVMPAPQLILLPMRARAGSGGRKTTGRRAGCGELPSGVTTRLAMPPAGPLRPMTARAGAGLICGAGR